MICEGNICKHYPKREHQYLCLHCELWPNISPTQNEQSVTFFVEISALNEEVMISISTSNLQDALLREVRFNKK